MENGVWDTDMQVRPHWDDGTPAHSVKKFGVINRYNLQEEFPILTIRRTAFKSCIDEILWIDQNFDNIDVLREHILNFIDFKDKKANEQFARQVLGYTDKRVQNIAELRAKFLYARLQNIQNGKIENIPLKIIVRELKLQGR